MDLCHSHTRKYFCQNFSVASFFFNLKVILANNFRLQRLLCLVVNLRGRIGSARPRNGKTIPQSVVTRQRAKTVPGLVRRPSTARSRFCPIRIVKLLSVQLMMDWIIRSVLMVNVNRDRPELDAFKPPTVLTPS